MPAGNVLYITVDQWRGDCLGVAGHPEGNPDIIKARGEEALISALREKQAYLSAHDIEGYIATQFLFEAAPVAYWAKTLRDAGVTLPIHVGVPGPATIKTLVKYAAMCGVGNSARFIRKQALNVTKLLTVSSPDAFVENLAKLHFVLAQVGENSIAQIEEDLAKLRQLSADGIVISRSTPRAKPRRGEPAA